MIPEPPGCPGALTVNAPPGRHSSPFECKHDPGDLDAANLADHGNPLGL